MFGDGIIVVAGTKNGGIGNEGKLPWPRLEQDIKFFREITTKTEDPAKKNVVVMGRRTWESIPAKFRPLPNRTNIVITTNPQKASSDVLIVKSIEEAAETYSELQKKGQCEKAMIIGGSRVYQEAMEKGLVSVVYYTLVQKDFQCDTFFPMQVLEEKYTLQTPVEEVSLTKEEIPIQILKYVGK